MQIHAEVANKQTDKQQRLHLAEIITMKDWKLTALLQDHSLTYMGMRREWMEKEEGRKDRRKEIVPVVRELVKHTDMVIMED